MTNLSRTWRRTLYATAVGAAVVMTVAATSAAASENVDVPDLTAPAPVDVATPHHPEDATIDIRPADVPRPARRRRRNSKKRAAPPVVQKFDNFAQTYGADGEVVTSSGANNGEDDSSKSVGVARADGGQELPEDHLNADGEHENDDGDDEEEEGAEVNTTNPHVSAFDQEAHDRRNREHQEIADRRHAEMTADMEIRRAEFEKRHEEHMAKINSHIMGAHRDRMAKHTERFTHGLSASHSRSFALPAADLAAMSASRSHSRHANGENAAERSGDELNAAGGDESNSAVADFGSSGDNMADDIAARVRAMHAEIKRHTDEHRARIKDEIARVQHEIRQMSDSNDDDWNPNSKRGGSSSESRSDMIEDRSAVETN